MTTPEYSKQREALRSELQAKVQSLLTEGVAVERIASIIGAEAFLSTGPGKGRKHGAVTSFDVKSFVAKEMASLVPIKPPGSYEKLDETIFPPGRGEIIPGSGQGIEKKRIIPKTRYFIDLLSKLGLDYDLKDGTNTPGMMRGTESYVTFLIPDKNKAVYICNLEGEATRILHHTDLATDEWKDFLTLTKDQLDEPHNQTRVSKHNWNADPDQWQHTLAQAIQKEFVPVVRENGINNGRGRDSVVGTETREQAPDGWLTLRAITKMLQKSSGWVSKRIQPLLATQPDWASDAYLNTQSRPGFTHYSPELVAELKRMKDEEPERAPEGWLALKRISVTLQKSEHWVSKHIPPILAAHPDWASDEYLTVIGQSGVIHYAPELIAELKRMKDEEPERAPEGWFTVMAITSLLQKSEPWVSKRLTTLVAAHPNWARNDYLNSQGKPGLTHYSPELIAELKRMKDEVVGPAPEGWLTLSAIAEIFQKGSRWVDRRIQSLLVAHPNWARDDYLSSRGRPGLTHYSPELIAELKRMKDEVVGPAPEGWLTSKGIAKSIQQTQQWVSKHIPAIRATHPNWAREDYLDSTGRSGNTHYSPELIAELKRIKDGEPERAPEGWLAAKPIAKLLHKSYGWVKKRLPAIVTTHPNWAREDYLDGMGRPGKTHYSPELVAELRRIRDGEEVQ